MSDCIVCGCRKQLAEGMTPEVVIASAVLHGVAVGMHPRGQPNLCSAHKRIVTLVLTAFDADGGRPEGAPLS